MFTLQQIKEAHFKVKSGADFPNYVQELIKLGVTKYSTYVKDGHIEFSGSENYGLNSDAKYSELNVAQDSNLDKFQKYLKSHQEGNSDYLTFCKQCSETGIEKWIVDMASMTCTYYDGSENIVLVETVPLS